MQLNTLPSLCHESSILKGFFIIQRGVFPDAGGTMGSVSPPPMLTACQIR